MVQASICTAASGGLFHPSEAEGVTGREKLPCRLMSLISFQKTVKSREAPSLPHLIPNTSLKPSLLLPLADEEEDLFSTRFSKGHIQPRWCNNTQERNFQCLCTKPNSHTKSILGFKGLSREVCFPGMITGPHLPPPGSSALSPHGFWLESGRGLRKHF